MEACHVAGKVITSAILENYGNEFQTGLALWRKSPCDPNIQCRLIKAYGQAWNMARDHGCGHRFHRARLAALLRESVRQAQEEAVIQRSRRLLRPAPSASRFTGLSSVASVAKYPPLARIIHFEAQRFAAAVSAGQSEPAGSLRRAGASPKTGGDALFEIDVEELFCYGEQPVHVVMA